MFAYQAWVPRPIWRVHQSRESVDLCDSPRVDVADGGHTGRRA